jgi:hypothetical protein
LLCYCWQSKPMTTNTHFVIGLKRGFQSIFAFGRHQSRLPKANQTLLDLSTPPY